ncbi:MAG: 4-hydroxyphenylacetate 3-hydroxylase N-terminal domain-containing protein [Syntrophales bacterium]|nr:4-hydroxyphenylacetate 3-hydroxylase N-terminal domain-containing protein [Syntrophales bacterium]
MALRSKKSYIESIRSLKTELYSYGEKVGDLWEHPCFRPAMDAIAMVYDFTENDGDDGFFTTRSPFIDAKVSRFLHIHQTQEDLRSRFRLSRFLVHKHGACIGARCVGTGALNSLYATTFEMDRDLGTDYHSRLLTFLRNVQEKDLAVSGAMMDVKGDRGLSPHKQTDPDLYLRVVEERPDGVVVRGAKASISGAAISNEIVVMPCTALSEEDKSYAVSFAVPSDAKGVLHIAEAPAPNMRRLVGDEMDYGNAMYGVHGSTHVIFDNVFVPRERLFMCGEYAYAGSLVSRFADLQRLNTSSCKAGHRDLLIGASAVAAEYNGVGRARHITEKLAELYFQSEMSFGCALASIYTGEKSASGVFMPDQLYVNIAKLQGVNAIWEGTYTAADITGGLVCTPPAAADFRHGKIGDMVEKYFKGKDDVPTENRLRMARLVEYLTGQGSVVPIESTHGAGSPQAQRIIIQQALAEKIDKFKEDAKIMAGIKGK